MILEKCGIIFLMEKIVITATAESIEQVEQLLEAGVDRIYVGEKILAFVCQRPLVMTNYVKSLSWFMMLVRN